MIGKAIKAVTATAKNIATINRRIKAISKLFGGVHSAEYEEFTSLISDTLDIYTNKAGEIQIRNNKENRKRYQYISATAKKVRDTPIQVLQRKAKKQREQFEDYREVSQDEIDFIEYKRFSNNVLDLTTEVYAILNTAVELRLVDEEEYEDIRDQLYASEDLRFAMYMNNVRHGGKKAMFERADLSDFPIEDYTEVEYSWNEDTGEAFTNPSFFGDI